MNFFVTTPASVVINYMEMYLLHCLECALIGNYPFAAIEELDLDNYRWHPINTIGGSIQMLF